MYCAICCSTRRPRKQLRLIISLQSISSKESAEAGLRHRKELSILRRVVLSTGLGLRQEPSKHEQEAGCELGMRPSRGGQEQ